MIGVEKCDKNDFFLSQQLFFFVARKPYVAINAIQSIMDEYEHKLSIRFA